MELQKLPLEALPDAYRRIRRDFPPIEYPPRSMMCKYMNKGAMQGRLCEEDGRDAGYAFLLRGHANSACMLFLYAVEPELRGKGVGSAFLQKLLEENRELDGMYAEVELAELAKDENAHRECLKRIAFYEKLGFRRIEGLFYSIYGLKMHVYYHPLRREDMPDAETAASELRSLYDRILLKWERRMLRAYPQ